MQDPREFLNHLYEVAVKRAQPAHTLGGFMPEPPSKASARTVVVGAGKAAGAMAQAFELLWEKRYPNAPMSGMVVTRYGHTPPTPVGLQGKIKIVEAAHPVPDAAGLSAAEQILQSVQGLTPDDLVVCLISGGGSSLLTLPCDGLSFPEKQAINQALLMSGANIGEMNCVRKHLSRIKGGRLAAACGAARLVTLAISDVPGDDVSVIASGPTVLDESTCADALAILSKYAIALSSLVDKALRAGTLETPKALGLQASSPAQIHLIATPQQSLEAAADAARALGVTAYILSDEIEGESREVAKVHAALAISTQRGRSSFKTPCVILSGGETTVTVRPRAEGQAKGKGGRAGEFCLGLAQALNSAKGIYALAADTDGIDGVEDNAGAFVMPDTLARAAQQGLGVSDHLARNDSYRFFAGLNDLHVTGPTHTNVNDFRAIYIA
jgi:glycerate 2-kinase